MMTLNRLPYRQAQPRLANGFSLIELMITLAILAVLIMIAAPSFASFITSNRLTAQINELVADLSSARNLAASSSRRAYLCAAADSTSCGGSDWAKGRILWVDYNGDGSLTVTTDAATNEMIKYLPALDGNVTLTAANLAAKQIAFTPYGTSSDSSTVTFTLCAAGSTNGRQISLNYAGRALAKRISTCP